MRASASRSIGCGASSQSSQARPPGHLARRPPHGAPSSSQRRVRSSGRGDVPVLALDLLRIVGERQPFVAPLGRPRRRNRDAQVEQHDAADARLRVRAVVRLDDELVQRLQHAPLPIVEEHRPVKAALLVVAPDREERAHVDLLEPAEVAAPPLGAPLDRVARGVREQRRLLHEEPKRQRKDRVGQTDPRAVHPDEERVDPGQHSDDPPRARRQPRLGHDARTVGARFCSASLGAAGLPCRHELPI